MSDGTDCFWLYSYKEAQMPNPEEFASRTDHLPENTDREFRRSKAIWKDSVRGPEIILQTRGIKAEQ